MTVTHFSYTNEVSAEFLNALDKQPYTEQQLGEFSDAVMAHVRQQKAERVAHPPIAIYRWATTGSHTRDGGVIQLGTTTIEITLHSGQRLAVAQLGDCVVYTNGSTARIITGSGVANNHIAVVGSRLDNGDEIINTPQDGTFYVLREGISMTEDFLAPIESGN